MIDYTKYRIIPSDEIRENMKGVEGILIGGNSGEDENERIVKSLTGITELKDSEFNWIIDYLDSPEASTKIVEKITYLIPALNKNEFLKEALVLKLFHSGKLRKGTHYGECPECKEATLLVPNENESGTVYDCRSCNSSFSKLKGFYQIQE